MTRASNFALRLALAWVGCGCMVGLEAARAQTEPRGKQPFEIIRSMQAIQDQIVLGNVEAQVRLPKLIGQIADRLLAADAAVWRDAKNARAAIVYLLSGGQPRVVRKILELGISPEEETRLMEGALAYVEGRSAKAKQILAPVEAKGLASALGGHIALVQSALVAKEDPTKAMRLLDQARLLDPGTLVEEAALRRETFLADETGDLEKFIALSSQYIRRFPKSAYADNFRRRFSDSITRFTLTGDSVRYEKIERLLNEIDAGDQLRLYLKMAQWGIISGKIGSARFAAERAVRLSKEGSVDGARSRLYEAAALILTSSLDKGLGELQSVDASRLPKVDAELKDAVARIAKQISKEPDDAQNEPEPKRAEGGTAAADAGAIIDSAQGAISEAEMLLQGTRHE